MVEGGATPGKSIKSKCCHCWVQRYIEKVNKLPISDYLYVRSYENSALSAHYILMRALIPSFLSYFLNTPVKNSHINLMK